MYIFTFFGRSFDKMDDIISSERVEESLKEKNEMVACDFSLTLK